MSDTNEPEKADPFPTVRFDTRAEFEDQLLAAFASAQREIWLADVDFQRWPLNSPRTEEALHRFLLASRVNRLNVLVSDAGPMERDMPRFMKLMRLFGHALTCRQPPEEIATRFSEECSFAIVDRARMVRRFHRDTMRGVAEFHPNDVGPWAEQFLSLWEEARPGPSATTLGL